LLAVVPRDAGKRLLEGWEVAAAAALLLEAAVCGRWSCSSKTWKLLLEGPEGTLKLLFEDLEVAVRSCC